MENLTLQEIDENYDEYIKSFIRTKDTFYRKIPNMRGVKDFDWVDQDSKENYIAGHATKSCVMANIMFFRDLIKEIHTNPNSSYQLCYTKDEIISGNFPDDFSVFMKNPDTVFEVESEVFASRLLNYFEVPVVYNKRVDKPVHNYESRKYVMSVDSIRKNEKLVLFTDIIPLRSNIGIARFMECGLKYTLDLLAEHLKEYLDGEGIRYTNSEIEDYKKFLTMSILTRVMLFGDSDFRNGNVGILIDMQNKLFRAQPNFDMEKSFGTLASADRFRILKEIYELYPEEYDKFFNKLLKLIDGKKGESICIKMAKKSIRSEPNASAILNRLYTNAGEIIEETMKFKSELADNMNNVNGKEILA